MRAPAVRALSRLHVEAQQLRVAQRPARAVQLGQRRTRVLRAWKAHTYRDNALTEHFALIKASGRTSGMQQWYRRLGRAASVCITRVQGVGRIVRGVAAAENVPILSVEGQEAESPTLWRCDRKSASWRTIGQWPRRSSDARTSAAAASSGSARQRAQPPASHLYRLQIEIETHSIF